MSAGIGRLAALGVALAAASFASKRPVLVWNTTDSVPIGLYHIVSRPVRVGDFVLVRLSGTIEALAQRRRYIGPNTPLLKRVAAMAGDRVCRRGCGLRIVGRRSLSVIALRADRSGRRMPEWQGCIQLRNGQLLVLGRGAESFDSRYFGPVRRNQILGAAIPLWLIRP